MLFQEVWPTYQDFKKDTLNYLSTQNNDPYWLKIDYWNWEDIYAYLLATYDTRHINYSAVRFKILFVKTLQNNIITIYKNQQIFKNDLLTILKEQKNLGDLTIITETDKKEINTTTENKSTGKNNTLESMQDTQTTFKTINDDDKVGERTQVETDLTNTGTGKRTDDIDKTKNNQDINYIEAYNSILQVYINFQIDYFIALFNKYFQRLIVIRTHHFGSL